MMRLWIAVALGVVVASGGRAEEGTWAFDYKPDPQKERVLNLRSLNEKVAGETGFIRQSEDGNDFLRGDGKPIRFWAVSCGASTDEQLAQAGPWLSSLGVNMVRICSSKEASAMLNPKGKTADPTQPDPRAVDKIQRMTARLKAHGIYTMITCYWVAKGSDTTNWGIEGYTGKSGGMNGLWGLLFFNEKLQAAYKNWLKVLLTSRNPYTGIPLAQDPAVGMIMLQNEDTLLFWTVSKMKEPQKRILGKKFGDWAAKRYGSFEAARKAWDGQKLKGDDPEAGVLDFYHIWDATQDQTGGKEKRINDQIRFWTETMHSFNKEMVRYLREDLGCKQLIIPENFKTASQSRLLDAERWCYSPAEVVAKNHYFSSVHMAARWKTRINKGDYYTRRSALHEPRALPVNMKQHVGHPHMVTESTWVCPNRYLSEGPFLTSAYMSLSGLDGFVWFASGAGYDNTLARGVRKWMVAQPMIAGMFPANALLYRKGYLQQARAVIHEERTLDDVLSRKLPLICEESGFDVVRDEGSGEKVSKALRINPLAFLVGRVEVVFDGDPAKTAIMDLSGQIDDNTVRSLSGEIALDHKQGIATINAPKAQGVCGFLNNAGTFALNDITFDCGNEYASILAVALDNKPIKESARVLLQIGTTAQPTGWKVEPASFTPRKADKPIQGYKLLSTGKGPWQIVKTRLAVTIRNAGLTRAIHVDPAGQAVAEVAVKRDGGAISFTAPEDCMYVLIAK